ncbi:MAG: 3-hydroxyacyl-ACP dehydratase FabZ [candidate division WOR-3 bacterium]
MEIDEIRKLLPHRYPMLLVDRITHLDQQRVEGYKNITATEPFLTGHFPGYPIMPGVLIAEAIAQTVGVLLMVNYPEYRTRMPMFLGIDRARFRRPVRPGDVLHMTGEILSHRATFWKVRGSARVAGELTCEAELLVGFSDLDLAVLGAKPEN